LATIFHPALHVVFEALGYAGGYAVYRRLREQEGDALNDERRWEAADSVRYVQHVLLRWIGEGAAGAAAGKGNGVGLSFAGSVQTDRFEKGVSFMRR